MLKKKNALILTVMNKDFTKLNFTNNNKKNGKINEILISWNKVQMTPLTFALSYSIIKI
jgi:hypothetical protein